ncbi:aldehyde dehydrogenase EutE, partial [Acinetobacter baumannii]|nr:aldehyde dehydrogenase EutE [Acinetobacter baumannii]
NNLPCIAEKEVVAVDSIADYLIFEMQKNGAYLLKDEALIEKLVGMVLTNGSPKRSYVGRDAKVILKDLG